MDDVVRSTIQKRDDKGRIRHGAEWLSLWSDPESLKTAAERRSDLFTRRASLDVERNLAAAARAISGDPGLQIAFTARAVSGLLDLAAWRGEIDSFALIRRLHSPDLHRQLAPFEPDARRLFDLCEQVRCDAVGATRFHGVRDNVVAYHRERLRRSDLINAHLASLIPLAEGLRMVLRDALLEASEPSIPASGFWMWDQWLRSRFSKDLTVLRLAQKDQASFSEHSVVFVRKLLAEFGSDQWRQRRFSPTERGSESGMEGDDRMAADRLKEDPAGDVFEAGGHLFLPDHYDAPIWKVEDKTAEAHPYTVFTTAHDRVATAADLADQTLLKEARASLERRRGEFRRDFARLVTRLQRRLLSRQIRHWSFDLDEGLIDASRLDRVILNPGFSSAYKKERESEFRNSVVSILLDNSGSMRGKPTEIACLAADMLSAALERCGVACEILGFTTGAWNGGNSAKAWVRAGRPPDPGRLNDLLHIIYKSADEPVRRSRSKICTMLQTPLLKENIDGEALGWAYSRLIARPETRKALIVISDGAPVDKATLEHNSDKAILDRHLRRVISDIEKSGSIELSAIGVNHPVAKYYRNSVQIGRIENLGEALVATVDRLLAR